MKIALCLSSLPLSGVGTSIGIIRSGLLRAGHEVDVVLTSGTPGGDYERATREGWAIRCCGLGVRFLKERLWQTLECLSRYDVVINNHSLETQLIAPCLPSHLIRLSVMRGINKCSLEHLSLHSHCFDAAIAISREMHRVMKETRGIECPVHLIPNSTVARREGLQSLSTPVEIAYIGRITDKDKNVMIVPDVARALSLRMIDFTLSVAGDGPDRSRLTSRIKDLSLANRVTMLGEISRKEAGALLQESHFTLLPSRYEGLSNVMLESMALGSVPIVSDLENFKWVLGDVAPVLQAPVGWADGYADRIAALVADPADYRRIQVYLRERQRAFFTPEATVNGYLTLLADLKSRHKPEDFVSLPFHRLVLPEGYRHQCSTWWRCLQVAREYLCPKV